MPSMYAEVFDRMRLLEEGEEFSFLPRVDPFLLRRGLYRQAKLFRKKTGLAWNWRVMVQEDTITVRRLPTVYEDTEK